MLELLNIQTQHRDTGVHGDQDVDGSVRQEAHLHTTINAGTVGQDSTGDGRGHRSRGGG